MKIKSTRFGELEAAEEQLINFPYGIPGFPDEKTFVLLPHEKESPFSFLQSATEANLTFLLVDPFVFFYDYEFELDDEVVKDLELSRDKLPQVFLIATIKQTLADMTVNLLAPLVINGLSRRGRQIILDKPEYVICQKVFPNGLPSDKGGK